MYRINVYIHILNYKLVKRNFYSSPRKPKKKEIKSKETKILVKFIYFKSLEDIEPDFKVKGGKLDLLLNDLLLDLCVLYSFLENEDNEAFKKVRQEEEY